MTALVLSAQPARRWLRRAGVVAASLLVVTLGLGAFLHTSAGRPLLARLARGHCPFASRSVDAKTRDAMRRLSLLRAPHLAVPAPAHTALGFALGEQRTGDVGAWASAHGLACHAESGGAGLACDGVPGRLLASGDDARGAAYFRFDAAGRLVGILRMQHLRDVSAAVALEIAAQAELDQSLGAPLRRGGEVTVAALSRGALAQARAEHRFRDFSASTSVTNLGAEGYLFTVEAESL